MELDWEKEFNPIYVDTDIILVADCVYDNDLTSELVSVLNQLLSQPSPKTNQFPVAFVASTIRNKSTFDFFLNQLSQSNIMHRFVNDYANVSTNLSCEMIAHNEVVDIDERIDLISAKLFNYCRDSIALSLLSKK